MRNYPKFDSTTHLHINATFFMGTHLEMGREFTKLNPSRPISF